MAIVRGHPPGKNTVLLVNLAYCLEQPTGTTTYALNLLPYLGDLSPRYLCGRPLPEVDCQPVAADMTAAQGFKGHLKRLVWTQTQLPQRYRQSGASLLFSPIPEAPLGQGIPFVITVHDLIPLRFFKPWAPLRLYCRHYLPRLLSQAQRVLCNSTATANDLINLLDCPADRLLPIPLSADTQRFRWLDLPTQNYFLCLGRCAPYKNWQRVIAAFARLPCPQDYELWLVGPSDTRYQPQLRALAQELGIAQQVKWLNFLPEKDLVTVLNQALALVFPSLWEGFGLPILEAMACGTPVITSNLASMPEAAGDAALLVDPYNVDDIAQAMSRISREEALRSHLRQAGFRQVAQFSQRRTGEATAAALAEVMARPVDR